MPQQRKYSLTLLGATGFTGGLCAAYLAKHLPTGTRWAIAGRNQEKLAAVCQKLADEGAANTPDVLVADVSRPDTLDAMAAASKLVLTTVGPYVYHGEPVVQACVENGTHYCDITGEPEFVNDMICRYHEKAVANQCAIVNCCGFDSIPHDAGVLFTLRELARVHGGPLDARVDMEGIVSASGTFSGGTWQSAILAFSRPGKNRDAMRRAKAVVDAHYPRRARSLPMKPRRNPAGGWLAPMPTIDPVIVQRSARALEDYGPAFHYGHYVAVSTLPRLTGGMAGVGGLLLAAQIGPLRRKLLQYRQSGDGPPPEQRARSWFKVDFNARIGDEHVHCRVSGGDPGYDETAKMLAETAMGLALDQDMPKHTGVVTPVMAMEDRLIERLSAAGMKFEVTG